MSFTFFDFDVGPTGVDDRERRWTHALYREFDNACYQYRVSLRRPFIRIDTSRGRWGMWDGTSRIMGISRHLIETYRWDAVIDVLKHEMAHMIVNENFLNPSHVHDESFSRAARMLGVAPWACASEEQMAELYHKHEIERENPPDDRLTQKVKKLLALANSPNEHEALLAIQRVKEIYASHNLSQLADRKPGKYVYTILHHHQKRIPQYQSTIASILASHFFVEVIHSHLYDAASFAHYKVIEILGTIDNVKMAEYVYFYLYNNLPVLWDAYKRSHGASSLRSKNSYYLGVLLGFRQKLDKQAEAPPPRTGPQASAALPLDCHEIMPTPHLPEATQRQLIEVAKRELNTFVRTRFPRLSMRGSARSYTDPTTFHAGLREGGKLSLHRGITHHDQGRVPLLRGK